MINAAQANRATHDAKAKAMVSAWEWVETQLPKIEKAIKKAIDFGQFNTTCSWGEETFYDLDFSQHEAAEAMTKLTYDFGYRIYAIPYSSHTKELIVHIDWKEA